VAKLGIKPGARAQFLNPPSDFGGSLGPLPEGVSLVSRGELDFGVLFVRQTRELPKKFGALRDRLVSNGMLWVAWPKKASGVSSDLTENIVRQTGLDAGLVDIKVCAIDATWSALKFVWRLRDR
jgi:hypothetical protein